MLMLIDLKIDCLIDLDGSKLTQVFFPPRQGNVRPCGRATESGRAAAVSGRAAVSLINQ